MITYVHALIVLAALSVFIQVPPPVPCYSSTRLPPTCPAGSPGIAQKGQTGENGKSCVLTTFPNGQIGCYYPADDSESVADTFVEDYFARISPERFTSTVTIIFAMSCLFGFGLWIYTGFKSALARAPVVANP